MKPVKFVSQGDGRRGGDLQFKAVCCIAIIMGERVAYHQATVLLIPSLKFFGQFLLISQNFDKLLELSLI